MQNLVVLMEPSDTAYDINLNGGNMCFNQFCINEDAAFELSKIYFLRSFSGISEDKSKGKGYTKLTINDIALKKH